MKSIKKNLNKHHKKIANAGLAFSTACAIHCILMPIVLPILPLLGLSFLANHALELSIILLSLALAFMSAMIGFFKFHGRVYPLYLLALAAFCFLFRESWGETWEPILMAVGAIFMYAAHRMNKHLCDNCPTCHESHSH